MRRRLEAQRRADAAMAALDRLVEVLYDAGAMTPLVKRDLLKLAGIIGSYQGTIEAVTTE